MADEADLSQARELVEHEAHLQRAREKAAEIPAGEPGECSECGCDSPRLVGGVCAPCRDGR